MVQDWSSLNAPAINKRSPKKGRSRAFDGSMLFEFPRRRRDEDKTALGLPVVNADEVVRRVA